MKIELSLPMPISVNGAYAGMTRRFKSPKYKQWEKLAEAHFKQFDKLEPLEGVLLVVYKFHSNWFNKDGTIKKKDVCNYEKVLSDKLSKLIDWFEDEHIFNISMEKIQSDRDEVDITISKYIFPLQ